MKKKTPQCELVDKRFDALPPAAYVYVKNYGAPPGHHMLAQSFGRVASAHAFAAALREYLDVDVVEPRTEN